MPDKISVDLGKVQQTLLLPLWGRAIEARKIRLLMIDRAAVDIIKKIGYDFSTIANNINEVTQLAWIARSLHIDRTIRHFLEIHPKAAIVNLGCGLDTTYDRVDNGFLRWYDLDLPDVIRLRKECIPESDRRNFISCSLFDDAWLHLVANEDNVFFMVAGVFYYFEESQMKTFFKKLADVFPGSEIIFDAASPLGVRVANKKVIADGGMDKSSVLKWGIERAKEIHAWDTRIKIMDDYPIFKKMKRALPIRNKIGTMISDLLNIMFMVHLKFDGNSEKSSVISEQ